MLAKTSSITGDIPTRAMSRTNTKGRWARHDELAPGRMCPDAVY
jgi:hypothetical protein